MIHRFAEPADLIAGVHPDIAHLSWLLGTWKGIGRGQYPNTEPFLFEQLLQFASDNRPFLEYRGVSWIVDENAERLHPSHTEQGYWRAAPENGVEAMIANPLGICEIWTGQVEVTGLENARITGAKLLLSPASISSSPTAAKVHTAERMYGLRDNRLLMAFDMGADEHAAESHVWISMERV